MKRLGLAVLLMLGACGEEHGHGDVGNVLHLMESADVDRGEGFFEATCATANCHGDMSEEAMAPDLAEVVPAHEDEALAGLIRNGEGGMPGLMSELDDQAIADVITYLRTVMP